MVFAVPQRILLICLLPFCTSADDKIVDKKILMSIVNNFENGLGNMGQYAVVFRVEKDKCLKDSDFPSKELLTKVKEKFKLSEVYVSDDLIAAQPTKEHSEFRLKGYLENILNNKDMCVIFFTVNSPCLKTCLAIKGKYNIEDSLTNLQKYVGIKAFAFKKVWKHDKKEEVEKRLKEIAPNLPYYQCGKKATCDLL